MWSAMYFLPWLIPQMPCYVCLEACFKVLINATTPCLVKLAEACSATKMGFLSPHALQMVFVLPPPVSAQVFLRPCSERSENWSQCKLTWFKKEIPGFLTGHFLAWVHYVKGEWQRGSFSAQLLWKSGEVHENTCATDPPGISFTWIMDLLTDLHEENIHPAPSCWRSSSLCQYRPYKQGPVGFAATVW